MSLSPPSERGSALIGVLLLLMMMSALTAAFAVSGRTETLVVRNHQTAAEARAAAEAGLNHAVEIVLPWILNWKTNYPAAANVDVVLDTLLTGVTNNPSFVAGMTTGAGVRTPVCPTCTTSYDIFLWDEDSDGRISRGWTELNGEEGGGGQDDRNRALVIQVVGYGSGGAEARLETIISPYKMPAIAADGDIQLGLSSAIVVGANSNGGVHANGDVIVSGKLLVTGLPFTKGTVTATGDIDPAVVATGGSVEGSEVKDIPDVDPSEFASWADRILTSTGTITTSNGGPVAACSGNGNPCQGAYGLRYNRGTWSFQTTAASNHTYYVQGPVTMGVGGTTELTPMAVTIIAEGSIDGTQGFIKPYAGDLLMVTGGDLSMAGNFNAGVPLAEGQILVNEQVAISGNAVLRGQLVVGDATSTAVPHTSSITGSVVITNDYDVGSSMFRVSGWREVR